MKLNKAQEIKGYIFKGWSKTKENKNIDFKDEEKISKMSYVDKDIITLFPIYEPIKYTINYNGISNIENVTLSNVDTQICIYDKEYKIKEGKKIKNQIYIFESNISDKKGVKSYETFRNKLTYERCC